MITIKNVKTLDGEISHVNITSSINQNLDAHGRLLILPALIDPHISLGSSENEFWQADIESVLRGGFSTILDIPSKESHHEGVEKSIQRKANLEKNLSNLNLSLNYFSYFNVNSTPLEELNSPLRPWLGCLLFFEPEDPPLSDQMWNTIFQMSAWKDLPLVINSRQESTWQSPKFKDFKESLLEKAIYYAERQNTRLYVLNISTKEELALLRYGRSKSLLIYAETTPQHLFPIQTSQADFLWEAINNGEIETIGSGFKSDTHPPEKVIWHEKNMNFLNPTFLLPLLLSAYKQEKISIENIVRLTRVNFYDIFKLDRKDESFVLVDLERDETIQRKDQSRMSKITLTGWPEYVIVKGNLLEIKQFQRV